MHLLQAIHEWGHDPSKNRGAHTAVLPQALFERIAPGEGHHHVGRTVGLKKIHHAHHRGSGFELRECTGLVEKSLAPPDEVIREFGRARHDHRVMFAQREGRRQVLLDGDVPIEVRVASEIGDAEGALPENTDNLIDAQSRAIWQHTTHLILQFHASSFVSLGRHVPLPVRRRPTVYNRIEGGFLRKAPYAGLMSTNPWATMLSP